MLIGLPEVAAYHHVCGHMAVTHVVSLMIELLVFNACLCGSSHSTSWQCQIAM